MTMCATESGATQGAGQLAEIIAKAAMLEKIPTAAADRYESRLNVLVEEVNRLLAARQDIELLIGRNPLSLMEMNHTHHAKFMTTVFRTNSFELLARTVPWVYRVYRARGFSYDYFVIELQTWRDLVERLLPSAEARLLAAVYTWMLTNHEAMITLSVNVDTLSFTLPAESGAMQEIFLSLLLHADHTGALRLADQSVTTAAEMEAFYLQVVTPGLHMIGALWEKNEVSVAQEHLATAIVSRVMAAIYSRVLPFDPPSKGKAVVTAAANEFHEIGPRMVADLLELDGWEVIFVGANTPQYELLELVEREKPFLVAISAAVMFNLDRAAQAIAAIKGHSALTGVKVLVGGLAFNAVPGIWQDLGADGFAVDAAIAVTLAGRWWHEDGGRHA